MVVKCSIFGCVNRKDREKDLEYYRIPAVITNQGNECEKISSVRQRVWLAKIGQDFSNKNMDNVRVCSAHFISGKKAYLYDQLNPDLAPSVNLGGTRARVNTERFHRQIARKRKLTESEDTDEITMTEDHVYSKGNDDSSEIDSETGVYVQTDIDGALLSAQSCELQTLMSEKHNLKMTVKSMEKFDIEFFRDNDERVKHLTGLPTFLLLHHLFQYLEPYFPPCLVLSKLKLMTMTLILRSYE